MNPDALMIFSTGIALAAINVGLFAQPRSDRKHGYTRLEDRLLGVARHLVTVAKEHARTSGRLGNAERKAGFSCTVAPRNDRPAIAQATSGPRSG